MENEKGMEMDSSSSLWLDASNQSSIVVEIVENPIYSARPTPLSLFDTHHGLNNKIASFQCFRRALSGRA